MEQHSHGPVNMCVGDQLLPNVFLKVKFLLLQEMDKRCTFWTTPSITHCPYGDQTHDSFQSIGLALDITSSQFQESTKIQMVRNLHQGDI